MMLNVFFFFFLSFFFFFNFYFIFLLYINYTVIRMLYMPGTCNGRAQISIYRYLWVEVGVATLNLALPTSSGENEILK